MMNNKDIEDQGWKELTDQYYLKGRYSMNVNTYDDLITIIEDRCYGGIFIPLNKEDSAVVRYQGACKDVKTLKMIEELIEIKDFKQPIGKYYENTLVKGTDEDQY